MDVSDCSFVRYVYPFRFDRESFEERRKQFEEAAVEGLGKIWENHAFAKGRLLPHVNEYVNPSRLGPAVAAIWQMRPEVLRSYRGLGGGNSHPGADWFLVVKDQEIPFLIEDVQLLLFPTGIGFLTFRVRPQSADADVWLDFLHYFRVLRRRVRAERKVGLDSQTKEPCVEPYFPTIASTPREGKQLSFRNLVDGLLNTFGSKDESATEP
jgi:hypothetical protein